MSVRSLTGIRLLILSFSIVTSAQVVHRTAPTDPSLVQRILNGDEPAIEEAGNSENLSYIPILKKVKSRPTQAQVAAADALTRLAQVPVSSRKLPDDDLLRRIVNSNDIEAIEKAGDSQTRGYIPYLEQVKRYPKKLPVIVALRRLGDVEELQRTWCASLGVDAPLSQFEEIGGWYSIQASEYFLLPGAQRSWKKQYREGRPYTDVDPPLSSAFWGLVALSKIVPNAPDEIKVQENSHFGRSIFTPKQHWEDLKPYIAKWQGWIAAHKDELSKLEPSGTGVNLSPSACKNREPVEKLPKSK